MATPTAIVAYLALFTAVGVLFLFINLLIGRFVRPDLPNEEKLEVYECGEPVIGSSFVQFDLRFYVVALLFIIFDVEVAFFFPWATVYGKVTQLASPEAPIIAADLDSNAASDALSSVAVARFKELGVSEDALATLAEDGTAGTLGRNAIQETAKTLSWMSLADISVFFAVLMVGFAYVWKRGDLDWVRAMTQQHRERPAEPPAPGRRTESGASILSA